MTVAQNHWGNGLLGSPPQFLPRIPPCLLTLWIVADVCRATLEKGVKLRTARQECYTADYQCYDNSVCVSTVDNTNSAAVVLYLSLQPVWQ